MDWDAIREREFPVSKRWAYLDHAAVAPLPARSAERVRAWADDQADNGVVHWPNWERKLQTTRRHLATLINGHLDEIAFVSSTTQGIGIVAEGFPWTAGDNVVTAAEEYPSNIYPWMNLASRGVEVRLVPTVNGRIRVDDLLGAMDASTKVLTISHVEFASGFRNNLDTLGQACRERGVAFFVDAIQGLGPLTIDVERTPIDFLAADGHKWLLGPEGAGFLYVRREWIERLRPIGVGWHSVVGGFNSPELALDFKPSAERWEGGSFAMPGLQGFSSSIDLLMEIGPAAVSARILDRAEAVRDLALSGGWQIAGSEFVEERSGIVALSREGVDPQQGVSLLRERGIAVACRRGRLRMSPHIYNNADDLDRLREGLAVVAGSSR